MVSNRLTASGLRTPANQLVFRKFWACLHPTPPFHLSPGEIVTLASYGFTGPSTSLAFYQQINASLSQVWPSYGKALREMIPYVAAIQADLLPPLPWSAVISMASKCSKCSKCLRSNYRSAPMGKRREGRSRDCGGIDQ